MFCGEFKQEHHYHDDVNVTSYAKELNTDVMQTAHG